MRLTCSLPLNCATSDLCTSEYDLSVGGFREEAREIGMFTFGQLLGSARDLILESELLTRLCADSPPNLAHDVRHTRLYMWTKRRCLEMDLKTTNVEFEALGDVHFHHHTASVDGISHSRPKRYRYELEGEPVATGIKTPTECSPRGAIGAEQRAENIAETITPSLM